MLTTEQEILCDRLYTSVRKKENIDKIVKEVTKGDFITILEATRRENDEKILGSVKSVLPEQIEAVLNRARELDLFKKTLEAKILFSKNGDEVKYISLIELITDKDYILLPGFLRVIGKFYKLGLKNEKSMVAEESIQIDNTVDKEDLSETSSLASDESTINSESNSATDTVPQSKPMCKATLDMGNKSESTSKAIVVVGICSVIAGLAVGGGLFAAGIALPILALIGIAVAAALVTGLIAGGITYEMSKPSSELKNAQPKVSSTQGVSV